MCPPLRVSVAHDPSSAARAPEDDGKINVSQSPANLATHAIDGPSASMRCQRCTTPPWTDGGARLRAGVACTFVRVSAMCLASACAPTASAEPSDPPASCPSPPRALARHGRCSSSFPPSATTAGTTRANTGDELESRIGGRRYAACRVLLALSDSSRAISRTAARRRPTGVLERSASAQEGGGPERFNS